MKHTPLMADNVIAAAAYLTGTTPQAIKGSSRLSSLVRARRLVAVILREHGFSYPKIARALNRDHSTIVHAVREAEKTLRTDYAFRADLETMRKRPRLAPRPQFWTLIVSREMLDDWRRMAAA